MADGEEESHTHYSPDYFNEEARKQSAVAAYLLYGIDHDSTGDIYFRYHGTIVLRIYEPFDTLTHLPSD